MRLSTMTNLYYVNTPDKKGYIRSVRKTHAMGFDVMDFCMCPMQRNETELNGDDWESIVYEIGNEAAKLGVTFSQSHLPYPKSNAKRKTPFDDGCEQNEFMIKTTERCIKISAMLGVKWAIVHPVQNTETAELSSDADVKYNRFIYDKYVNLASKLGVGIAFENMADVDSYRRFGVNADELLAIVNSYNSEYVGVCWDFGHGNRVMRHQELQLKMLGSALKATHVDDNRGKDDLHEVPFMGTVKWDKIMPVLKEIDYRGDFNFELSTTKRMPEELRDYAVKLIYETGKYLLALAK